MCREPLLSWLITVLGVCIMGTALGIVATTHQVREGYGRLQAMELERWRLQEQYTRLLLEINTWAAPHRISQIAVDDLFMQTPDLSLSQVVTQ